MNSWRGKLESVNVAQKLLSDSQQRLELALKGADLGLWDYDIANNEGFVDQTWADIFGYSLDEITGQFKLVEKRPPSGR